MDYYFLMITIIDIFVLGIMCILTKQNETLNEQQRHWFIRSFLLIIAISLFEVITIMVDGGPVSLRWINIIANYLGFGLTPAVPICLAFALEDNRNIKYAVIVEALFLLLLVFSFPLKWVFYVDLENHYMRGNLFGIYLTVYFVGIIFLLVTTLQVAASYQCKNKNSVYPIAVFLIMGTMVQVIFPEIHVTWMCVTLLSILYFTYCNGMWQQMDAITGLLNQKSYLNQTSVLSQNGILVVFDVDDFKRINDNFGHLMGDKCLKKVADCIKKAYARDGFCYRIGGDEFCVLLNEKADEDRCYRRLIKELDNQRKTWSILPYVSVGSAAFLAGDNVRKVKEQADNKMYQFKKEHKQQENKSKCSFS